MEELKDKRALTIAEAAKYTCVSRGTLELWITKRLLAFEELPGQGNGRKRFRRIRKSDLDEFLEKHYKDALSPIKPEKKPLELRGKIHLLPRNHDAALKRKS